MHNPLTTAKMIWGSYRLVRDPTRLDEVIEMADSLSSPEVMEAFVQQARQTPEGAHALTKRPRVHLDLDELATLPPGTLGREFADHMRRNHLDPADLPSRPARDEHEYVRAHLFETHDIWHVVTGFDTDPAGELGLQAFYLAQLPARLSPLLLAIGLLNTLIYKFDEKDRRMDEITRGWQLGKSARPFFGVDWTPLWTVPLADVRTLLGLGSLHGDPSRGLQ